MEVLSAFGGKMGRGGNGKLKMEDGKKRSVAGDQWSGEGGRG
jgi:hypothetical protein